MADATRAHRLSVVVPIYRGESTLPSLVEELAALTTPFTTPAGHEAVVDEVLLVHDCGPDESDRVIRELGHAYDVVRPVWLSRNFGQHPATLAGLASSAGDWVATLDEDGQHDPAFLGPMLDTALAQRATLVYADPTNPPPHGVVRNVASKGAKRLVDLLVGGKVTSRYHSYRLMLGEHARAVSAYAAAGVYLDVALSWVTGRVATCPVTLRAEGDRPSGYNLRSLMSHFWRMVLTSGTRLLRVVAVLGLLLAVLGLGLAVYLALLRLFGDIPVQGWTSVMVTLLVCTGALMTSLGVIAEYLGVAVNMALGKPPYVIVSDPEEGPLGRVPAAPE